MIIKSFWNYFIFFQHIATRAIKTNAGTDARTSGREYAIKKSEENKKGL